MYLGSIQNAAHFNAGSGLVQDQIQERVHSYINLFFLVQGATHEKSAFFRHCCAPPPPNVICQIWQSTFNTSMAKYFKIQFFGFDGITPNFLVQENFLDSFNEIIIVLLFHEVQKKAGVHKSFFENNFNVGELFCPFTKIHICVFN